MLWKGNGNPLQHSCLENPRDGGAWGAACMLSCFIVFDPVTLWTVAHQAPQSKGFSRQEYWSGLPFPPPGDLPDLGIEPMSLKSHALAGGFFTTSATGKALKANGLFELEFS